MSKYTMKPTIQAAKETAQRMNARQVVVCAFDYHGRFGVVSYGMLKAECQDIQPLCDAIADGLQDGSLPAPTINKGKIASVVERPSEEMCLFKDGNQWCATFADFVNLQESQAGFGGTAPEALAELLRSSSRHDA